MAQTEGLSDEQRAFMASQLDRAAVRLFDLASKLREGKTDTAKAKRRVATVIAVLSNVDPSKQQTAGAM